MAVQFLTGTSKILELYTTPAIFLVLVFCWYQICWIFGISVGIVPPFFVYFPPFLPPFLPPFFQKGVGAPQKGGHCPPFEEKGGHCPLFDTEMCRPSFPSVWYWLIPEKYRPNTDRKYPDNMSHLFYCEYYRKIKQKILRTHFFLTNAV